jgi:hypothetical protein
VGSPVTGWKKAAFVAVVAGAALASLLALRSFL